MSTSQSANVSKKFNDPGWQYADKEGPNTVICRLCGKKTYGGISRFKKHIAHVKGDVTPCPNSTEEIKRVIREHLEAFEKKKSKNAAGYDEAIQSASVSEKFIDPRWQYGDKEGQNTIICRLFGKKTSGGISRFKKHIAHVKGDVTPCPNSTEEIKTIITAHLETSKKKKSNNATRYDMPRQRKRKRMHNESTSNNAPASNELYTSNNPVPTNASFSHTDQASSSSHVQPNNINIIDTDEAIQALDFGDPDIECSHCKAIFWSQERCLRLSTKNVPIYNLCCRGGRISLPSLNPTPETLLGLLNIRNGAESSHFVECIRIYNSMFAFSSFGANTDDSVNDGRGPYVFKVSGQVYHRIGSLLPPQNDVPKFAQLYMLDTSQEVENRMAHFQSERQSMLPRRHIVEALKRMLDRHNKIVQGYHYIRDRIQLENIQNFRIRIQYNQETDDRQYSTPTAAEVVGLVVGDFDGQYHSRDIIVEHRSEGLQRISSLHKYFIALQYPLLHTHGEESFTEKISFKKVPGSSKIRRGYVTMLEYYCYRLHIRLREPILYFISGRLFQQFIFDLWCCIEQARLWYILLNQTKFRCDTYNNLRTAALDGDMWGMQVGKRVILPSNHVGSPRYLYQNYQDAISICRRYGSPHLFITFTCNPLWPEITRNLINGQTANDRPDLVCRVFKMKLDELIEDIRIDNHFGPVAALIYTVEFQKRGLPHAHIIVWLRESGSLTNLTDIDSYISAELPNPDTKPIAYSVVTEFMIHGPCGHARPNSPCMKKGHCSKNFPKEFHDSTVMSDEGFVEYKRRDTGITVEKNGVLPDNRYVVPHNLKLLMKYHAHINVERCHTTTMIKYLFKYVCKGRDRAYVTLQRTETNEQRQQTQRPQTEHATINEVSDYLDCRYIAPPEAIWRIFQYHIHYSNPTVERLPVHLPNENSVVFSDYQSLDELVSNEYSAKTKLTAWFELNTRDGLARDLTYLQVTSYYTWHKDTKTWDGRMKGDRLSRMFFVHPRAGELYYLQILLNIVRGAKCFEDIRTVDGQIYPTFKEACEAYALLENDGEWINTMEEAAASANSEQLRYLFVEILLFSQVSNVKEFWNTCWKYLYDDIIHELRTTHRNPHYSLEDNILKDLILYKLEDMLAIRGNTLKSVGLPEPSADRTIHQDNRLIIEQLSLNTPEMQEQVPRLISELNEEQKCAFHKIVLSVDNKDGKLFFVYGAGGTGNTFLWQALTVFVRAQRKIVLTVASSGLASLLMQGGITAHSRFKIPIELNEEATCDVKKNTQLAGLLKMTSLIIWDEAPMSNRICFEALDRTMRDILGDMSLSNKHRPFGGVTVVLGGDFRQTLPVVPGASRYDTISASITNSYLWRSCIILKLTRNMRLTRYPNDSTQRQKIEKFADWLLSIGNGTEETIRIANNNEPEWVRILENLLVDPGEDEKQAIIDATYPNLNAMYTNIPYLRQRAIITPKNDAVDLLNESVLALIPGNEQEYLSADSIDGSDNMSDDLRGVYPIEFLNTISGGNLPCHKLILKVGVPIMLLRNIDQPNGLCNGTRAILIALGTRIIQARVITGKYTDREICIPRIIFIHKSKTLPFVLRRRQYPVRLCYAMTINKSQGQSLDMIGLYLREPVFSHGQLYVALSRTTSPDGLKILITNQDDSYAGYAKNIVFRQIFSLLGDADYNDTNN